jgi:hypothetical protein
MSEMWVDSEAANACFPLGPPCLHVAFYKLCRIHGSLPVTPAMEAGIADRVWGIADPLA